MVRLVEGVYSANIPQQEKRWSALRFLLNRVGGSIGGTCPGDHNVRLLLEQALMSAKAAAGLDHQPTIIEAKLWLRSLGEEGRSLASRVSRLSKARNDDAHPDPLLDLDITVLAAM